MFALWGSNTATVLERVFAPWPSHRDDADGTLRLGRVLDESGAALDEAVVARRGDTVEINIHGGPLVAKTFADALERHGATPTTADTTPSANPALPAAHRVWRNPAVGAELLHWLPRARSELVVRALSSQWAGGLSRLARKTLEAVACGRDAHTDARAGRPRHAQSLRDAARRFEQLDALLRPREVVFLGPPNAGKSSLVNALVGRAVSLVHDRPGTTRDWVRELALLHSVPAHLTDTAGLWEQAQGVDAQAVARSRERAQSADVVILCGAGQPPEPPPWLAGRRVIRAALQMDRFARSTGVCLSAVTGEGLDEFKHAVVDALGLTDFDPEAPAAFTTRQRDLLLAVATDMDRQNPDQARKNLRQLLEGVR